MSIVKPIALAIAFLLLLCFVANPLVVKAQNNSKSLADFNTEKDTEVKTILDRKYVYLLGLQSEITGVRSTFVIENSAEKKCYSYKGDLLSGKANFSVITSQSKIIVGNQIITTLTETVTGTTNYNTTTTENETTIGNLIVKYTAASFQKVNSSGSYNFDLEANSLLALDGSTIKSSVVHINENIFGPAGHYTVVLEPPKNGEEAKAFIAKTNPETEGSSKESGGATLDWEPPVNWAPIDISDPNHGSWHLGGIFVYWATGITPEASVISALVEAAAGVILKVSVVTAIAFFTLPISILLSLSAEFPAENGDYDVTIMYFEVVTYNLFGLMIPVYGETGYNSNRYYNPLEPWQLVECPWTYFDCFDTWYGQWALLSVILFGGHTNPWPLITQFPDPPVTMLGYDESVSANVDGIPVWINGTYVGGTGSTVWMPPGDYEISVVSAGFHYFDVNGTTVYDNPANTIIEEEDMTITAHYYYNPMHPVTVNAYTQYSYPGNLLPVYVDYELAGYTDYNGACSVLVPEGYHFIEIAYYVDDQYDNFCHFDSPQWTTHTLWYLDLGGSYWYGEAYLEVTSDMNGEAWYNSDG
jgi:hypothetical protein